MAVIHCGEQPGDCGTYADANTSSRFEFTTTTNNPLLLSKREVRGTCYTPSRYYNAQNDPLGLMASALASAGQWGVARTWTLYPFHIEARGIIDMNYNEKGELVVTLRDVVSTLTGSAGDIGRAFRAQLYTAGDFGWAVNVKAITANKVVAPSRNDGGWNKCMGGWWSAAATQNCSVTCPGGGTSYWWNRWDLFGTPYERHGNSPTRRNSGMTWNLGKVDSKTQIIGLFARAVRGNCSSAYFSDADGDFQQCIFITIPPQNICPPTFEGMENERDICLEKIYSTLKVHIPTLGVDGVNLHVMYEAIDREDQWQDSIASTQVVGVKENTTVSVLIDNNLIPDTTYFLKMYLQKGDIKSDEIMVCDQKTPYMPSPTCLVPMLTEEECELLAEGECLEELTEETAEECC